MDGLHIIHTLISLWSDSYYFCMHLRTIDTLLTQYYSVAFGILIVCWIDHTGMYMYFFMLGHFDIQAMLMI